MPEEQEKKRNYEEVWRGERLISRKKIVKMSHKDWIKWLRIQHGLTKGSEMLFYVFGLVQQFFSLNFLLFEATGFNRQIELWVQFLINSGYGLNFSERILWWGFFCLIFIVSSGLLVILFWMGSVIEESRKNRARELLTKYGVKENERYIVGFWQKRKLRGGIKKM